MIVRNSKERERGRRVLRGEGVCDLGLCSERESYKEGKGLGKKNHIKQNARCFEHSRGSTPALEPPAPAFGMEKWQSKSGKALASQLSLDSRQMSSHC